MNSQATCPPCCRPADGHRLRTAALMLLLLGAALIMPSAKAWAGSLGISPMRIDFDAARSITHVTVTNPTQETLAVELEVLPWPTEDAEQSARDLTVNPPTATLRPGAKLTVRIGLTKRLPADRERAYRLYVTELPQPLAPGSQGISVRLRVGVPIFVAAVRAQAAALQWSMARSERGTLLVAHNPGNTHERVHDLSLTQPSMSPTAVSGTSYVLAGARVEYLLPATADDACTSCSSSSLFRICSVWPTRMPMTRGM